MKQVVQPDVIPQQITQHSQAAVPPPAAFTNDFVEETIQSNVEPNVESIKPPDEELYANVHKSSDLVTSAKSSDLVTTAKAVQLIDDHQIKVAEAPIDQTSQLTQEQVEHIEPIYQNQEDLTEYIEDTGVKAVKLVY